jgi:hypothetical protein
MSLATISPQFYIVLKKHRLFHVYNMYMKVRAIIFLNSPQKLKNRELYVKLRADIFLIRSQILVA